MQMVMMVSIKYDITDKLISPSCHIFPGYPAKRALSAMRKHGG